MATSTQIEFETDSGNSVTVTATRGSIRVSVDGSAITFEDVSARLDRQKGMDVLNCGHQRTKGGEKVHALIPVAGHKADIEQLLEDSKNTDPLAYEVGEHTKTVNLDGWKSEVAKKTLSANKTYTEMTDREQELHHKIGEKNIPDDAEAGDVLTPEDLLDDARTTEEKEQDALDEASESGEEVVISSGTAGCNDSRKECNLDHVTRVATPDGEVETRRTHTY